MGCLWCFLRFGVRVWGVPACFVPPTPPSSVLALVWVTGPLYCSTRRAFEVLGLGLGWFLFFFVLSIPLAQGRAVVWVTRPLSCGRRLSFFRVRLFFILPTPPPPRDRGRFGYFCHSDCGTGLCEIFFLLFGGIRLGPPRCGCRATSVFRFTVGTFSPRPPFQAIWRCGFPWRFCCPLGIGLLSFPFFLAFLVGFVVSPFKGVGVAFEEPNLRLVFYFVESGSHEFSHISAYTVRQSGLV